MMVIFTSPRVSQRIWLIIRSTRARQRFCPSAPIRVLTADGRELAAGARLSAARSAVAAAHVCHQLFGAQGITLEGPVFHVSRRIRQLASQAPGDASARGVLLARLGL